MMTIYKYGEVPNNEILARRDTAYNVTEPVARIIAEVIAHGDAALRELTERFDGVRLTHFEVSAAEFDEALSAVEPELLDVLREAADNIRAYHAKQRRQSWVMSEREGVVLGMKLTPIEKVGLYVPNGTVSTSAVTNYTALDIRRVDLNFNVAAGTDHRSGGAHRRDRAEGAGGAYLSGRAVPL